jgi:hypothetical protein
VFSEGEKQNTSGIRMVGSDRQSLKGEFWGVEQREFTKAEFFFLLLSGWTKEQGDYT